MLALLAQSVAVATPMPERPHDAREAAAALAAIVGPGVIVCTQTDDSGAPAKAPHGCDQCPLCRLAANAAALSLPLPPTLAAPLRLANAPLGAIADARRLTPIRRPAPLPRGPPASI